MKKAVIIQAMLLSAALAVGGGAQAKNGNSGGGSIGNATVDDVTLAGSDADALSYSSANPMQGTSGFAGAFGTGSWSTLGTYEKSVLTDKSDVFNFAFTSTGKSGKWTITNASTLNATLDLTLAIHASNASTAFLFDGTTIAAGQSLSGEWDIEWLNNGGQVPGFSNAVLFARDVTLSPVPEPATLPMLGAGLALLGTAAWRRRKNNN